MSVVSEKAIKFLESALVSLKEDYAKFENGNKAAGTRARNTLQGIKLYAQELRLDIQDTKNKE